MQDLVDRVAVVTGAASGIGRALADGFAREGMRVVLADIEAGPLDQAVSDLLGAGHEAVGVVTDVSNLLSVENLADAAREAFGDVHVLCNNAGVLGGRMPHVWEAPLSDWHWIMGVNFWGVVHGLRAFLPRMLEHGAP